MQLSDTLSTSTQQRVVILGNDSLVELFDSIHPMRLSVKESKRATKYAVEDGTERSDHIVTELTEIQIDLVITDDVRNTFKNLRQAFLDNTLVTVQTKVAMYESMLITDCPHDETRELGDAVNIALRLQKWVSVVTEYGELPPRKVENPAQSSTLRRGRQPATEASADIESRRSSLFYDWANK